MFAIKNVRITKLSLLGRRYFASENAPSKLLFENLSSRRSLLRMRGGEMFQFLQGLITNDINHVEDASGDADCAMFTMFLNKPGRVLYDAIIYKRHSDDQSCLIECDQAIVDDLRRHLMLYRVRKKIDIDVVNDELSVWTGFIDNRKSASIKPQQTIEMPKPIVDSHGQEMIACPDPRLNQIGTRFIVPLDFQIQQFQQIFDQNKVECSLSTDEYNYTEHRYVHGISEGSTEIQPLKVFPFEANCDYLHGISFHKGCYLGQEFTARTYHTGVIRKRIMPIVLNEKLNNDAQYDTAITNDTGQLIGKLKGIRNRHAIGSLKVEQALSTKYLKIGEQTAITKRPSWWPRIL